ncbi:MAG: AraC family transcriptional regulator [Myxococcales bacterium]|nr:AraC family transcriptional regulator [Myxococcales bacterium]
MTQTLLRAATMAGLDRASLLAAAGLDEMAIADHDAYIDERAHERLAEAILRRLPGVNFGLRAGQAATLATAGALAYVLRACATLGAMLEQWCRYHRFLTTTTRWSLGRAAAEVSLELDAHTESGARGQSIEGQLTVVTTLGRALTGVAWRPLALRLRHAPAGDPAEHRAFFGIDPEFEADTNAMTLAASTLALPVQARRGGPGSSALADALLGGAPEDDRVSARVRAALRAGLSLGQRQRPEIAAQLGVSDRTLARRLQEEGTSFAELLDAVRHELARAHLERGQLAVYEVAFLLGYAEPSAFHRAFKRWTGVTPREYVRAR